jgi:hypothetical protein
MKQQHPQLQEELAQVLWGDHMIALTTLLIAGASMAFAVHQW